VKRKCGFAAIRAVRLCLTRSNPLKLEALPLVYRRSRSPFARRKGKPFRTECGRAAARGVVMAWFFLIFSEGEFL
jgi:hypothetical protein